MSAPRATADGTIRNDDPQADDWALVVRPIGGSSSGSEISTPTTGTLTSVEGSIAEVSLLAANPARAGFSIKNLAATGTLYVLANTAGGAVSSTFHTVAITPGAYYEDPYNYVGEVFGIWGATTPGDAALVNEYTPVA